MYYGPAHTRRSGTWDFRNHLDEPPKATGATFLWKVTNCSGHPKSCLVNLNRRDAVSTLAESRFESRWAFHMKIGQLIQERTPKEAQRSSCGSGWSVPCVSVQLTLSQRSSRWYDRTDRRFAFLLPLPRFVLKQMTETLEYHGQHEIFGYASARGVRRQSHVQREQDQGVRQRRRRSRAGCCSNLTASWHPCCLRR